MAGFAATSSAMRPFTSPPGDSSFTQPYTCGNSFARATIEATDCCGLLPLYVWMITGHSATSPSAR